MQRLGIRIAADLVHLVKSCRRCAATSETLDFDFDTSADAQRRLLLISEPIYPEEGYLSFVRRANPISGLYCCWLASGRSLRAPLGFSTYSHSGLRSAAARSRRGSQTSRSHPSVRRSNRTDLIGLSTSALSNLELNSGTVSNFLTLPSRKVFRLIFIARPS